MEQEEILNTIVQSLLEEQALVDDPEWDTFSLVASVSPSVTDMTAFRYTGPGRGTPTPVRATNLQFFRELQEATQAPEGRVWEICIIKIERDRARGSVNFVYGEEAEIWKVTPATLAGLAENLRPQPADFMS